MDAQIYGNLFRQMKALELLESLLEEEFGLLRARDTEAIGSLEFSIHELLRQIAVERMEVKNVMQDTKVAEYADMLVHEEGEAIRELLAAIDKGEQRCARMAGHNAELSLALLDQSHELLSQLHDAVAPKQRNVYSAKGLFAEPRAGAALISGRL
jgi:hypothetical protein